MKAVSGECLTGCALGVEGERGTGARARAFGRRQDGRKARRKARRKADQLGKPHASVEIKNNKSTGGQQPTCIMTPAATAFPSLS